MVSKDYNIGKAFSRIENELISSMIRNLEHHKAQEIEEGFEWAQWQVEQLRALEEYRKRNLKKFPKQFKEINSKIPGLIEGARADGQMDQEADILEAISKGFKAKKGSGDIIGAFFEVNDRKINALIDATTNDFERAEIAILRRTEDQYRKVIFDAQVYANAGGTTYEKAVDMATKDFLSKGIDCIEYKNGARHTLSDYADMAIKTAVKRAYLTGEGEKRKEWGIATVIVNKRGNPCPKCAPFCGKVLIDDVWSGGTRKDGPYPLMSTAVEYGLYHPRCKDSHTTYFPEISTADDKWSKEELEEIGANYEADQKRQYAERQAEKYGRLSGFSLDPENKQKYGARADRWKEEAERLRKKADLSGNPFERMFYNRQAQNMDDVFGNKMLQNIFHRARYKGSLKPTKFEDITRKWTGHQKGPINVKDNIKAFHYNGKRYYVDNVNVILNPTTRELEIAEIISQHSNEQVIMVPRITGKYKRINTPDFYLGSRLERWDIKELKGKSKDAIRNAIKDKEPQASRFVIDITKYQRSDEEIFAQAEFVFYAFNTTFVEELVIINGNTILKAYKKK